VFSFLPWTISPSAQKAEKLGFLTPPLAEIAM
jgi:hypothetical protein